MKVTQPLSLVVFIFFLFGGIAACKKNSSSANNARFSLNGGAEIVCPTDHSPGYDFLGGSNCEFQFDRIGANSGGTSTGEIGVFIENDCNAAKGSLPYVTTHFRLGILYYPTNGSAVPYSYPFTGVPGQDSLGTMTLTITGRSSNRVIGTIAGVIYRSDIGYADSVSLNCSFDLNMPVTQ
jgi:hypothetical protein